MVVVLDVGASVEVAVDCGEALAMCDLEREPRTAPTTTAAAKRTKINARARTSFGRDVSLDLLVTG